MDSTKPAYEPVSTEEESASADESTSIVEAAPETQTPPEVAEKNEKNAEKTAAAEEEEEEEKKDKEQNGNVALDLDSSIVPLKEAEEVEHTDEPHANGKANGKINGENGMVSIEIGKEEMQVEDDGDLKRKKEFHCPKCPSMPTWRPTKWTPTAPKSLSSCAKKDEKEVEEGNVVQVEQVEEPAVSNAERYKWIAAVSFLLVSLVVVILIFVLIPTQGQALPPHQKANLELHLNCDCPDNDLVLPLINATVASNNTETTTTDLTTLSGCVEACIESTECVGVVFEEAGKCILKSLCEKMDKVEAKMLVLKS